MRFRLGEIGVRYPVVKPAADDGASFVDRRSIYQEPSWIYDKGVQEFDSARAQDRCPLIAPSDRCARGVYRREFAPSRLGEASTIGPFGRS
jgi:hypothetical protein